jgi:hypothetical protein
MLSSALLHLMCVQIDVGAASRIAIYVSWSNSVAISLIRPQTVSVPRIFRFGQTGKTRPMVANIVKEEICVLTLRLSCIPCVMSFWNEYPLSSALSLSR